MNKEQFMKQLKIENTDPDLIAYYDELISDMIEQGESEESIIIGLNQKKVINNYIYIKNKEKLDKESKGNATKAVWIVILLLFSSPVLFPLGIVLVVLLITFFIVGLALLGSALAVLISVFYSTITLIAQQGSIGLVLLSIGAHLVALSILVILGTLFIKGFSEGIKKIIVKLFGIGRKGRKEA